MFSILEICWILVLTKFMHGKMKRQKPNGACPARNRFLHSSNPFRVSIGVNGCWSQWIYGALDVFAIAWSLRGEGVAMSRGRSLLPLSLSVWQVDDLVS